jgi:hypothetical protein
MAVIPITRKLWIWLFILTFLSPWCAQGAPKKRITVMCYMNGDNDLAHEVLYAIDEMELAGSSEDMNILALVDGNSKAARLYGQPWEGTKLLYITRDEKLGEINSRVVADLGEQNLGDANTLHEFVKTCLHYPADRYLFFLFSHGRGIIDTLTLQHPDQTKKLGISTDETSRAIMTQQEFHDALESALSGVRFDLMVFFSCLTNMVEIGYSLSDITRYLVASEDEIRIVNEPPGTFQIRGIKFEDLLKTLHADPQLDARKLGKMAVDGFIGQYMEDVFFLGNDGNVQPERFPASLALIDCSAYDEVAARLDRLARHLSTTMRHPHRSKSTLKSFGRALTVSQRYRSFLNLEYYDLLDFLDNLKKESPCAQTKQHCQEVMEAITNRLIVYERHTFDCRSKGVSIYLSHVQIPENIYQAHHRMYRSCQFSRETNWDEMISLCRMKTLEIYSEILLEDCLQAYRDKDSEAFARLNTLMPWALRRDLVCRRYSVVYRYLDFLSKVDRQRLPRRDLECLETIVRDFLNSPQRTDIKAILHYLGQVQESWPTQKSLRDSGL